MKNLPRYLALVWVLFTCLATAAQQKDSSRPKNDIVSKVQAFGREEVRKSAEKYRQTTSVRKQEEVIEDERNTLLKANDYLKNGLDTSGLPKELQYLEKWYSIAADGVLVNKGTVQTYRNLTTTYNILLELTNKALLRKNQIDRYAKDLGKFRYRIDSLNADSMLYNFPTDSAELVRYFSKYVYIAREMGHVDSAIDKAIITAEVLQAKINAEVYKLSSSLAVVARYQGELSDNNFSREFSNLWQGEEYIRPFKEILRFSKAKGRLTLRFYTEENIGKIVAILLLILASMFFLRALKQKLLQDNVLNMDHEGQLGIRYPFLTALVIVLSLFQFIFRSPPYIFSCLFSIVPAIALIFVFRRFITPYWLRFCLIMVGLFLLACADNLVLQESFTERWWLFFIALAGMATGATVLSGRHKERLRERLILYFIGAHVLLEAASLFCNLYGRYNLSKVLMICGYLCVIEGIVFLWTVRLINETLSLASNVYKSPEMRSFYINFSRVGNRAPTLLYVLMVIGWLIVCGRSFYVFQRLSQPVFRFFLDERQIGDYSFSIGSLLLFFLIIALSVIVSKVVSFFASDRHTGPPHGAKDRKAGLGSWLLLVRVTIICLGLFLALAATGFPMDRLTIVVGALGVGVGLGLQTLVNNLVSGLIIAFERPVNVGDTVDIGGMSGRMKSIGFRSSVITTTRGADLVIPNGDLLSSHMVNWTMGGNRRLVDVMVGVAYGTDLGTVKEVLLGILQADERIVSYPVPQVLFLQFGGSSIDVQLNFWVRNFNEMLAVKSDLIEAIDKQFREKRIEIPFPRQEVYIHRGDDDPAPSAS